MKKIQKLPNGDGDIHAMFNGFVNINREYLPEDFQQLPQDFEWVNIHGSEFDLEPAVTYRGPACIICPRIYTGTCRPQRPLPILAATRPPKFGSMAN